VAREPDESMRVSDTERDEALKILGEQAAVGRLTLEEHQERSARALAAKTRGELAALTSDLPADDLAERTPGHRKARWMVAIMGGTRRRGRFRGVGSINAVAIMGGDEIDLRDAEIDGGELTINTFAIMGGPTIYLPDSAELELGGFSIMGGTTEEGSRRAPSRGAPVVRVRGFALMGGTTVYRLPPQARGLDLREARRLAKSAGRGELPSG
jgi:hypothetical protein